MKRWNGWGDSSIVYEISPKGAALVESLIGTGTRWRDVSLADIAANVPASRLPPHPLVDLEPAERVKHARGQSLSDWIDCRSGIINSFPDGVAFPSTEAEVRDLIRYADDADIKLIPYGGGTSVVGHINPLPGDRPILTVDLSRLSNLQQLDESSLLATFGAGINGTQLEAALKARGYTLGHFPQSFEYSTLGGWIATRSRGQQSIYYGGIDSLFAGGRLLAPAGTLEMVPFPATAAGPDLRQLVLGSEGRLGVITEATVRVMPVPPYEQFGAVFFANFEYGMSAVKQIAQAGLPVSMLRLSTPNETMVTLAMAGHEQLIGMIERGLSIWKIGDGKCMLLIGATGTAAIGKRTMREAIGMARANHGFYLGTRFGKEWAKSRFRAPYLRNELWDRGYAVDTLETAVDWSQLPDLLKSVEAALRNGLEDIGERVFVFTHLSHVYATGSSVYVTYLFRLAADPEETRRRWHRLKTAASEAIVNHAGTITHQHGVGLDHLAYAENEIGSLGVKALQAAAACFDPRGILNPGKLFNRPS